MSERTKKLLIATGFIISVFVFAFILYKLFFQAPAPEDITVGDLPDGAIFDGSLPDSLLGGDRIDTSTPTDSGLSEADDVAQGGITQTTTLTTGAVGSTSTNGSGVNYYDSTDGRFYTIDEDGDVVALSDTQFPEVESVVWNKDAEKAVLEFPDGSNVVYDFTTERQVTLPSHWEDFDFSDTSDEIIAKSIALDPNNRWLVIAEDDGSRVESIQALGENADKVDVNWTPNDQVVAFADTSQSLSGGVNRKIILPVGKNSENFKGLVVEGLGFLSNWSPSGKQLLYSVAGSYSDNKPLLWIVDATAANMGENRQSLNLNTWADKCTWGSDTTIYCAAPLDLPANAGLARDLYRNYDDALYEINLSSGRTTLIAIPENQGSMNNLQISDNGTSLYFQDERGVLQLMKLK